MKLLKGIIKGEVFVVKEVGLLPENHIIQVLIN